VHKTNAASARPASPAGTPEKPIGLRDLAAYLGLSRSTVSLVLNDSPVAQRLTPETRERVLRAAAELGYKANYFARMLNKKRSHMVGILSPDLVEDYDSEILNGIEHLLIERNYLYFVSSHHWDKALIRQRLEVFAERGAEGVILINTPIVTAPDLPLVSIGGLESDLPLTRIAVDNSHGVRLALEHLFSLGHRQIALFKGHTQSSDTESRWTAYMETAQALGLSFHEEHIVQLERIDNRLNSIREGFIAGQQLLKARREFTALLAFNDLSAIGAIHAFRDAGRRVPEEISVIGFDDIYAANVVYPALTTVRQPLTEMGTLAASELLARIEDRNHEVRLIMIEPELVIRQSTGACPRGAAPGRTS
jgi:LacI family transcriptional regulator